VAHSRYYLFVAHAGPPREDAGVDPPDANPAIDAAPKVDAGVVIEEPKGCSCRAAGSIAGLWLGLLLLLPLVFACGGESAWEWNLPPGTEEPAVPADNPMSEAKVELGRRLFFDVRLSFNETIAYGTCHEPARAFTDGKTLPVGATGDIVPRNAMSLANVAYYSTYTWADPTLLTLEEQARVPMFGEHPIELGMSMDTEGILDRFRSEDDYRQRFADAFPDDGRMSTDNVVKAIASYERALISVDAPYDRYARGDGAAMSDAAKRGLSLFFSDDLKCHDCHNGIAFSSASEEQNEIDFANTGLYNIGGTGAYPDSNQGLFAVTMKPEDMGRFRVPTLRNVTVTAPYMHDGSMLTLEEVIDAYERGGRLIEEGPFAGDGATSPHKSTFITGFTITDDQRADLIAFLEALTDQEFISAASR
jgi:cytochrome c peroxidase